MTVLPIDFPLAHLSDRDRVPREKFSANGVTMTTYEVLHALHLEVTEALDRLYKLEGDDYEFSPSTASPSFKFVYSLAERCEAECGRLLEHER